MADAAPSPEDAAASRAAEQARLRKERREAKIRAGGAARLNKITGLGGGLQRDPPSQPPSAGSTPPPSKPAVQPAPSAFNPTKDDDPEEVDISQHYYEPRTTARIPPTAASAGEPSLSEAQLRQMMLGFERPLPPGSGGPGPQNPFLDAGAGAMPPGMEDMADDPMMKILQSMMGGAGGPGGNPFGAGPGGLGSGLFGGPEGMQQAQADAVTDSSANVWRIIHAVFALGLGLYIALTTTFTGTKMERDLGALSASSSSTSSDPSSTPDPNNAGLEQARANFFYIFTSVEAVLLTTRFFLDKKRSPPSGIIWTVSGFLPGRLQTGVRTALRYGEILSTVRSDALVCVFVLGVCCWLRS
ncbi:hypothetical protein BX600DRAFT_431077 [Xylariales sp. PMI_506]|nr:hypothetical protein BX600DRAFT_431077 [Xylariales sp. PMI_506]